MTRRPAISPLTIGSLARDLIAGEGRPMNALRCYEMLTALWIRSCDTSLPVSATLRGLTLCAAARLAGGNDTVAVPEQSAVLGRFVGDESIVRLPASLAVQGVEWPDLIAVAQEWLNSRATGEPVHVVGVRTGGAYLAPLVATHLAASDVDVRLSSLRPGEYLSTGDRRVLLVDDPPLTGSTLLDLATQIDGNYGVEVAVPVFEAGDVQPLRDAGIPVTVLPRDRWQSTRRLDFRVLAAYLETHGTWPSGEPGIVEGFQRGRENSVRTPWPGLRHRSPARAAVRLRTAAGVRHGVAGWVPPGIFGDAARATATGLSSPVPPTTFAVSPALVISEDLTPASPIGHDDEHRVEEAVDYVLARADHLPLTTTVTSPIPAVLRQVAEAITNSPNGSDSLHRLIPAIGTTLPDNRCEAEKWVIDPRGRLRKTGHLTHAYRRDNELLTPLIDLAAISIAFGCDLPALATMVDLRTPGNRSLQPALAAALLCYGVARGEQVPRTYNPQRAAATAVEAHRLQRGMAEAATLLRDLLHDSEAASEQGPRQPGYDPASPARGPIVVHKWRRPPAALVQPLLPFTGTPAAPLPLVALPEDVEKIVVAWARNRFIPVRVGQELLLAPLGQSSTWPEASAALEDLAERLPHPDMLAWCGVPVVSLEATSC